MCVQELCDKKDGVGLALIVHAYPPGHVRVCHGWIRRKDTQGRRTSSTQLCDERQHALQPHAPDAETPPVPGLMLKTHTIDKHTAAAALLASPTIPIRSSFMLTVHDALALSRRHCLMVKLLLLGCGAVFGWPVPV